MDFDELFGGFGGVACKGSDYILVAVWIFVWILDHPGFFTIRRWPYGLCGSGRTFITEVMMVVVMGLGVVYC